MHKANTIYINCFKVAAKVKSSQTKPKPYYKGMGFVFQYLEEFSFKHI